MTSTIHRLALAGLLLSAPAAPALAAEGGSEPAPGVERAVVRLVTYAQRGDWYSPWDMHPVQASTGTGFVVSGGRILTNAHVVSDARFLVVFLDGDPEPHEARVVVAGHDCDLAVVEPLEAGVLAGRTPLQLGGLPALRSSVETYGYPAGGDQMSSTRGVVSRIEAQAYVHSGVDSHLAIQTDASINPGSSGGPVIQDGRVVGVAFQAAGGLENTGYVIPVEVVRHFLADVEDGTYGGYPDLAVQEASLENPAARALAGMGPGETGVRVEMVWPGGSADGFLRAGDVLLAAEGRRIANDGTVADAGLRLVYGLLVDRLQVGESVRLRVLRAGERLDLAVPLRPHPSAHRQAHQYDRLPRYYVYAGLVFEPLDLELLKTFGREWTGTAPRRLLYEHLLRALEDPASARDERVVLLRRLSHRVNVNGASDGGDVVVAANGRAVRSLADLVEAIESNQARFHVLELGNPGVLVVLDRVEADAANREILELYGVGEDRRL